MCLADAYKEREPLPALITFPVLAGIQDVMGFRLEQGSAQGSVIGSGVDVTVRHHRRDLRSDGPALVCSAGVWEAIVSQWTMRTYEREYCRVVKGQVRVSDRRGRHWEFAAGSAFLLLRGFEGTIDVIEPTQIVYMVFSLPDGCALDWCMVSEGRTALGQERLTN
jgi:uncharacterized cupin superfamily protein